jgi:hypothetical protein
VVSATDPYGRILDFLDRKKIHSVHRVLKRGPLSLVSTIEELLERKSSSCGLESPEYGRRDLSR